jgi:hypothetical protein
MTDVDFGDILDTASKTKCFIDGIEDNPVTSSGDCASYTSVTKTGNTPSVSLFPFFISNSPNLVLQYMIKYQYCQKRFKS